MFTEIEGTGGVETLPDTALLLRREGGDHMMVANIEPSGALGGLKRVSNADAATVLQESLKLGGDSRSMSGSYQGLDAGRIPDTLIYQDKWMIVFADPGGDWAPLYYRGEAGLFCDNVQWPPLIYIWTRSRLYVLAYDGGPVSENTALFHAPLPNIGRDGEVCIGQADMPEHFVANQANWSLVRGVMRDTSFSHINHTAVVAGDPDTMDDKQWLKVWQSRIAADTGLLEEDLVSFDETLGEFLQGIG
ncbi:MAG: hypothetical protein LAT62_11275 [Natronospirillum sp.]|uniref:hypothetical protein n=1 Tax=Natronospirillum sp. TaxID=2812955 RepID=UPI0025FDA34E|nr:hypothetical protein [Natronospirillum sp.]MCH8552511.1 hypothetical protein [Natronospirillum sp.]